MSFILQKFESDGYAKNISSKIKVKVKKWASLLKLQGTNSVVYKDISITCFFVLFKLKVKKKIT